MLGFERRWSGSSLYKLLTGRPATSSGVGVGTDSCQVWEVRGSSAYQRLLTMCGDLGLRRSSLPCFHRGSSLKSRGQDPRRTRWDRQLRQSGQWDPVRGQCRKRAGGSVNVLNSRCVSINSAFHQEPIKDCTLVRLVSGGWQRDLGSVS